MSKCSCNLEFFFHLFPSNCCFAANVQLSHLHHRQPSMELAYQTLNAATTEAQSMEIAQVVLGFVAPTCSQTVPLLSPIIGNVKL